MKSSEVKYIDQPNSFYISYSKMHYDKHNTLQKFWNSFTNLFLGYYQNEEKRKFGLKIKSLKKRFFKRIKMELFDKTKKQLKKRHHNLLNNNLIPRKIKLKLFETIFKDSYINRKPSNLNLVLTDQERIRVFSQKKFFAKINPKEIKNYDEEKEYIKKTVSAFLIDGINYKQTIQYQMMIKRIENNERPLYGCKNEAQIDSYFFKLKKSFLNIKTNGFLTQQELMKKSDDLQSKKGDEIEVFLNYDGQFIVSGGSGNHRLCIAKELRLKKIPVILKGIVNNEDSLTT